MKTYEWNRKTWPPNNPGTSVPSNDCYKVTKERDGDYITIKHYLNGMYVGSASDHVRNHPEFH